MFCAKFVARAMLAVYVAVKPLAVTTRPLNGS
jgi:hypothetical protein